NDSPSGATRRVHCSTCYAPTRIGSSPRSLTGADPTASYGGSPTAHNSMREQGRATYTEANRDRAAARSSHPGGVDSTPLDAAQPVESLRVGTGHPLPSSH